jgi:hypothetical protein
MIFLRVRHPVFHGNEFCWRITPVDSAFPIRRRRAIRHLLIAWWTNVNGEGQIEARLEFGRDIAVAHVVHTQDIAAVRCAIEASDGALRVLGGGEFDDSRFLAAIGFRFRAGFPD